jgi:hypothetical protein
MRLYSRHIAGLIERARAGGAQLSASRAQICHLFAASRRAIRPTIGESRRGADGLLRRVVFL